MNAAVDTEAVGTNAAEIVGAPPGVGLENTTPEVLAIEEAAADSTDPAATTALKTPKEIKMACILFSEGLVG